MQISDVYIYGNKYRLKTDMDSETVASIANFVDKKMREMQDSMNVLTTSKIAVMAAFDIAAEYLILKKDIDKSIDKISEIENKIDSILKG
ncbi:cell division protein ZapA [Deferribacteraceae bacterium V6Fe1]|uniref:cell division protein ZapA n=1 Tax=Deferrivibrio essentukiensis TaxID=2880922 RepID=UPI0019B4303F|nr:cell division protein ZapA [Deferrivibrio essentukiensis]MBC7196240.1 cell division protein ZapA [Deferribacterales bacterium]MCB4204714.1 cell division protein ZapA [Deferrivibrio essentukiensis]UOD34058.1 cell division protein ZapA [Deferribacteraceae bacterium V6Fe1]